MATTAILNEERMKAYSTAAEQTFSRIKRLLDAKHQELAEYDSLIQKLEELPRKRTHSVMCPVGSVGFLPASIVHTNEVLVGLGDGYFVDTTCYDAVQILQRRKKVVEKNIADLHEHENLLKNYSKYARELFERQRNSDEVEIREEYDEVKEAELRRKRKSRVVTPRPVTKTMADINAEAELMKRLEELEQQELRNGELDPFFDDNAEEEEEAPPTLDKILEKLDDDDTKCIMSILSSDKSALSSLEVKERQPPSADSGLATVKEGSEPAKSTLTDASAAPLAGVSDISVQDKSFLKAEPISSAETVKTGESTGYFRGDDLMRMLAEQQEEYEENPQSYQPPPGISTEAYQRILRAVEEMNDDDSDDVDEDDNILEESEEEGSENEAGSELDSDDLSEPENGRRVNIGPFTVQNLGPNAPVIGSEDAGDQQGDTLRTDSTKVAARKPVVEMGPAAGDDAENVGTEAEDSKKKKPRKKKSVVFAENLEDATLIDKNAPPSDVRGEPSTSTSDTKTTSILRNAGEKTPTNEDLLAKMNTDEEPHKFILPGSTAAFTGVVQEKNVEVLETGSVMPTHSGDSTKRQSLFKMKSQENNVATYSKPVEVGYMTKKQWGSSLTDPVIKEVADEMYNNEIDKVSAIVNCDPTIELKMRFEKECKINSERAAQMVPAVLKRHPCSNRPSQSREKAITELKKALSRLSPNCVFRALHYDCVLRIIRRLPMTSMLSLATSCKTFNSIINEQNHGLKDVHTIRIDFEEQRKHRVIVISVQRCEDDPMRKVERYMHCTRCPKIDNELDEQLLKLPCSTEGVGWVANILPALLVNARVSNVDFVGEHGVVLSHAFQFQKLSCKRRVFHVERLSFGIRTSVNSSVACCMFWMQLLRPQKVKLYPLSGGLFLTYGDLRWFLTQTMEKIIMHDLYNMNLRAISEVIWDWYCGRQNTIPHTEIVFAGAPPNIDDFLEKINHKTTGEDEDGHFALLKRNFDGEMKQLLVPSGESRLVIKDYHPTIS
ncbi:hypothetical protein Y032_0007g3488 [Ancylostoma ceylanicum]|uniref:F-box domain-containing protein n=1 Tax=Ancylostoma ceylanicum TaxID=53326 RepID=A0A016VQ53_9BILA|nr:hypothetical protein Y032_0007g3488 [Ancylostoma ceylanicum]